MPGKGRPRGMITNRNPTYLLATRECIDKAAEKTGITTEQAEFILSYYFRWMYLKLRDDRMPAIRVPFMGIITPTLGALRRALTKSFLSYRRGSVPKFLLIKRIKRLWPIRQRLARTQGKKRNNNFLNYKKSKPKEAVYQDWINIPEDFAKKHIGKDLIKAEKEYYKGRVKLLQDRYN